MMYVCMMRQILSRTDQRTNEQGDSRSRIYPPTTMDKRVIKEIWPKSNILNLALHSNRQLDFVYSCNTSKYCIELLLSVICILAFSWNTYKSIIYLLLFVFCILIVVFFLQHIQVNALIFFCLCFVHILMIGIFLEHVEIDALIFQNCFRHFHASSLLCWHRLHTFRPEICFQTWLSFEPSLTI